MDASRWERVQELFHEARSLEAAARRAWLERSCDGDAGLRAEVEALLSADEGTDSVLDGGVERVAGRLLADPEAAPRTLGPYRITGVLGEGGMGVVYRAERPDLGRAVAVKVLRDGWLSPARRARFAAEQRTLARLEHPGIARLYDADVLPDGTPWFAMELVEGEPLTAWCERRGTPLAGRLALFRAACDAVAFAQRHAVVHRDLKPSNLLVDAAGQVKLLDFGIARHLDPEASDAAATRTGVRLMTPAYAAPEQLRGEPAGLHTDAWALGVILYELLAGRRPFDRPERSQAEAELAVLQDEPERPSAAARRAATPLAASRATWQELDVLCLTALQKAPQRRYASAEALLRDVDHLLAGRPLDARRDGAGYRVRKFVARHRVEVAAVALVALALAATVTTFTIRLARARDAAVAEAARAQHVQAFLQKLLQGGDQAAGPSASLKVVDLLADGEREAAALGADPATQADLFSTLGVTAERLGQLERADGLLRRALAGHRALPGGAASSVAGDLTELAHLWLDQARFEDATRLATEAVALARERLGPDHPALPTALLMLGRIEADRNRLPEAARAIDEAVALRSRPGVSRLDLASALAQLADLRITEGKTEEGLAGSERALGLLRAELGERHPLVAERIAWLGWTRQDPTVQRQAIEIYEAWYGHDHPRTAGALSELGQVLSLKGQVEEAERIDRDALAIQLRLHGERHPDTASAVYALGMAVYFREAWDEAAALCRRATDTWVALHGAHHTLNAMGLGCEANAILRKGVDPARAEALARRAAAVLKEVLPADNGQIPFAEGRIGWALLQQRRFAEAVPYLQRGFEVEVKDQGRAGPWTLEVADRLGKALRGAGRIAEADALEAEQRDLRAKAAAQAKAP